MSLRGFGHPAFPQAVPPPREDALTRIAKAVEALAGQYVQNPYCEELRLDLTANQVRQFNTGETKLQWLVVTVGSGDLLVALSWQESIVFPGSLRFLPTSQSWVVPLASKPYQLTFQANAIATAATVILLGG